jgi:hypothetical protein
MMLGSSRICVPTGTRGSSRRRPPWTTCSRVEAELVRRRRQGRVVVPSGGELRGLPVVAAGPVRSPARTRSAAVLAKERRRR